MSKDLVVKEEEIKDLSMFAVAEGEEEHLSQDEIALPFLKVAQKMSPQIEEGKPEYIEGLKPGHYFNSVSGTNYGDTLKVQVHGYFHNITIFKGEKGAGTFSGTMTTDEFRDFEKKVQLVKEGGDLVQIVDGERVAYKDTHNFLISLPEHQEDGVMVYPLTSTGCKAARTWNTLHTNRRANGKQTERFATIWEIKTATFESNGFSYKQTSGVRPIGWATPELMAFGASMREFTKAVKNSGVSYNEAHESGGESVEDSDF